MRGGCNGSAGNPLTGTGMVSLRPITGTAPVHPSLSFELSMSPVPKHLVRTKPATIDPDADWMRQADIVPAASFNPRTKKNRYIPAIPLEFVQLTLAAGDALALLLVALMEMRMRGTSEIAIGPGLWEQVDNPSKRVRARLLRQIACLPESLCTIVARKGRPHLLKAGSSWPCPVK